MRAIAFLLALVPVMGQEFEPKFDRMITEINRGRFDKALNETFPIQTEIRKRATVAPALDAGLRQRMNEMNNTTAVISAIALLRRQVAEEKWDDAQISSFFVGMGLSRLWSDLPAHQRLNFAQEDLKEGKPGSREMDLRRVGFTAVEAEDWDAAKSSVAALLALVDQRGGTDPGMLYQATLTLRGLLELHNGDVPAAERSLVDSMKVPGEIGMRTLGPNFKLAIALLERNRRQPVDQFLALVQGSTWREASRAADWRKQLAAGEPVLMPRHNMF